MMNITPDQLLTTTRSVRKRLDFYRPVSIEVIRECVEIATQAPSGSNIQPWQMIVITDPIKRRNIADFYREAFQIYQKAAVPGIRQAFEEAGQGQQIQRVIESAEYLDRHLHKIPVLVIPCLIGATNPMTPPRLEHADNFLAAPMWASVLPAVWSFMLAARLRGLGTSLTTLHLIYEKEIARLLDIPYERVTQVALIPLAYTIGTEFRPAQRKPVDSIFTINSWNQAY